jgi:hypothetical protein
MFDDTFLIPSTGVANGISLMVAITPTGVDIDF